MANTIIDADFTEVDENGKVKDDVQQTVQNTEEKKESLIGKIVGGAKKNSKLLLGMAIGAGLVYGLTKMANRTGVPAPITDIQASIPDQIVPNAATPDMESTINEIVDEIKQSTI